MVKRLRIKKKSNAGRSKGKITVRHRGGGHKRAYRLVDFKRLIFDREAVVLGLEYDPNRSAKIALVEYLDNKEKAYFLAPRGLKIGVNLVTSKRPGTKVGNRGPLKALPLGSNVYNVRGMIRSAGNFAVLQSRESGYAQLKLPSGEIRLVPEGELASVGVISNSKHNTKKLRKAGQNRWRGKRPAVRGSAMSAGDHPHGGGEGRQGIGLKHPKTPWGKPALGKKTRKKKHRTNKYIVKRRK
jgi:large subunit ribosomal protein L2